jgi:transketolase
MLQTLDWPGPIYIRLAKGFDPIVSSPENTFKIGDDIALRIPAAESDYVLLVSTGVMTTRALEAADLLAKQGIEATVLHLHTVKPLDADAIRRYAGKSALVVTLEEHTVIGGLGSAVTDALVDGMGRAVPLIKRIGLPDSFTHSYGSQDDLMELYGLQPPQIAAAVRGALKELAPA